MKVFRALLLAAAFFAPCVAHAQPPAGPMVLTQVGATTGGGWVAAYPDAIFQSANITTATTTLLVSGAAGTGTSQQALFLFYAGVQATGANSGNTFNFEFGQGSTCQTNTVPLSPLGVTAPSASPAIAPQWTGGNANTSVNGVIPSSVPYVIPPGYNICLVTAGTTTSLKAIVLYALHA